MKIGDKVRIIKPKNIEYNEDITDPKTGSVNCWVLEMDNDNGTVCTLAEYDPESGWWMKESGYGFLECWLEPVSESAESAYDRAMKIVL